MTSSKKKRKRQIVFFVCSNLKRWGVLAPQTTPRTRLKLYTDASLYAMGAYLTQIVVLTQEETPLGVFSQSFSSANSKRSAFEHELIAATTSVRYFTPYLHNRTFTLYTDNKELYYSC